jgi:hypothetical protein
LPSSEYYGRQLNRTLSAIKNAAALRRQKQELKHLFIPEQLHLKCNENHEAFDGTNSSWAGTGERFH